MNDEPLKNFSEQCIKLTSKIRDIVTEENIDLSIVAACFSTIECRMAVTSQFKKEYWLSEKSTLWDEVYKDHEQTFKLEK